MPNNLPRLGPCGCKRGLERDNCPNCEGSGQAINWAEYHRLKRVAAFVVAVDKGFAGLMRSTARITSEEGYFSWSPCELCGSTLGGDRETLEVENFSNNTLTLDVCVDCVMYVANGDEPEDWRSK